VLVGLDVGTSGASAVDVDESLVAIHTDDCEVGNVSVPDTFRGHEDLREFWTSSRSTFGEMRSEFRNVFATEEGGGSRVDDAGYIERRGSLLRRREHPGDRWGKVRRFMAYFTPATSLPTSWTDGIKGAARPDGSTD
jgi:hypothetical protein